MNLQGCFYQKGIAHFKLFAPLAEQVSLIIKNKNPQEIALQKSKQGYHCCSLNNIKPGMKYSYKIQGDNYPDPVSFSQESVHERESVIVDHFDYKWSDSNWSSLPLNEMIIYEIHTGTFSRPGTFKAIEDKLDYFLDLGINTIELMPVAQFSGKRNWGYDGVFFFAAQNSYGGVKSLKSLIDKAHQKGIAVILDVVYNHFGPEGNYSSKFAPYTTKKYGAIWGNPINYDDKYSDGVRDFIIQNALYWLKYFHIDALRLDAVHGIFDASSRHILEELNQHVTDLSKSLNKHLHLIAESDLNDPRIITAQKQGGYGLQGQWCDDFHHAVHALLTKEETGYYIDYHKKFSLKKALENAIVFEGDHSLFRKKKHGRPFKRISRFQKVVFIQNHDQIGNRPQGERLSSLVSKEKNRFATFLLLLGPYIPLLFMGEEYGENSPFCYFISHNNNQLMKAVVKGRKRELKDFGWKQQSYDPRDKETFYRSKLNRQEFGKGEIYELYKKLISLRKKTKLDSLDVKYKVFEKKQLLIIEYYKRKNVIASLIVNPGEKKRIYSYSKTMHIVFQSYAKNDLSAKNEYLPWQCKFFISSEKNKL